MNRQFNVNPASVETSRARNFFRIERTGSDDQPHAAMQILHRQPVVRDASGRASHYLRIERGITT